MVRGAAFVAGALPALVAALADAAGGAVSALGMGAVLAEAAGGVATAFTVGGMAEGAALAMGLDSLVIVSPGLDSLLVHAATATSAAPWVSRMRRSRR